MVALDAEIPKSSMHLLEMALNYKIKLSFINAFIIDLWFKFGCHGEKIHVSNFFILPVPLYRF